VAGGDAGDGVLEEGAGCSYHTKITCQF
jgi:hypothetical protein